MHFCNLFLYNSIQFLYNLFLYNIHEEKEKREQKYKNGVWRILHKKFYLELLSLKNFAKYWFVAKNILFYYLNKSIYMPFIIEKIKKEI